MTSFYDFKTMTLEGKPADLGMYKGKVSLVVNVASKCGYTPQYEGLEKLQKEKGGKDFNVLGFPSNDFGGQEPGTAEEIVTFCKLTYGVTFPMFEKVVTKAGSGAVADLLLPRHVGKPAGVELQQVRHRQGRQDRRVLPEQGDARTRPSSAPRSTRRWPPSRADAGRALARPVRRFALRTARSSRASSAGSIPDLAQLFSPFRRCPPSARVSHPERRRAPALSLTAG